MVLRKVLTIIIALLIWQALFSLNLLPDYLLGPSVIFYQFLNMFISGELIPHIYSSLFRSYTGFFVGSFFGIIAGLISASSSKVKGFFDPVVSLTYPVPKIAILPILMVWFGIGDTSKVIIIILACFYPCFINAYYGANSINHVYIWSALNMGASKAQILKKVILPGAMPQIFAGLRIALALSFILLFSSEMIGANSGLGFLIIYSESYLRFDIMFVAISSIGILGFLNDRLLLVLRKKILLWHEEL